MCGIAGIIDLEGEREINRRALEAMTQALAHRGPDGHGYHFEPGYAFGHRRLAILDRSGGKQPFIASAGRTALSFDGRLYNFAALAEDLTSKGRKLRTRSDAEVLAELIDLRGPDALEDLDGMFAFAAYSPRTGEFLLARDRFGEKPLYYTETQNGYLLFASEIDALLASRRVADTICEEAVADYLFHGFVPDPGTIYRTIRKLPPGHYLSFQRGQPLPEPRRYWQAAFRPDSEMTLDEASEEAWRLLIDAVSTRMVSDRPVETFLSGGLNSGLIAAALSKAGIHPDAATLEVDEASLEVTERAAAIASQLGLVHRAHALGQPTEWLDAVATGMGEPYADGSALLTHALGRFVAGRAPVGLGADGADELFAGHARYRHLLREDLLRRMLPAALRRGIVGPAGRLCPDLPGAPQLRGGLLAMGRDQASGIAEATSALPADRVRHLLDPALGDVDLYRHVRSATNVADTDDPLSLFQAVDFMVTLPGCTLARTDRMGMAHGVEIRSPFLAPGLVDLAMKLPRAVKIGPDGTKQVLRQLGRSRLPEGIGEAPGRGRAALIDRLFAAPGSSFAEALSASTAWKDSGFFTVERIEKLADRHARGRGRFGQALYSVLMFDAFLTRNDRQALADVPLQLVAEA